MTDEWKLIPIFAAPSLSLGVGAGFCLSTGPFTFRWSRAQWLALSMAAIPILIVAIGVVFELSVIGRPSALQLRNQVASLLVTIMGLLQLPLAAIVVFLSAVLPQHRSYLRILGASVMVVGLVLVTLVWLIGAGQMLSGVSL